jgi:hypothetical protein
MRISRFRYQPIEGGTLGGHFALHVTLGAGDDPESLSFDYDTSALATKIHDIFEALKLQSRFVRGVLFDAREAFDLDTAEMLSLLGVLRDWKINVVAWVGEAKRPAWFELCNYITAFVTSPHWSNFRVNEIRFVPTGEKWIEPEVYEVNDAAPGYIDASNGQPAASVLVFTTEAKRPWGVIPVIRASVGIDFPLEALEPS